MRVFGDYCMDDCLSTKRLCDWLRGLHFDATNQISSNK